MKRIFRKFISYLSQFELFKLVNSFFNDEEGAEGALKRFVLNDVVASFNS